MNPPRFDYMAKTAATAVSRRQVMRGLGATALAGIAWSGHSPALAPMRGVRARSAAAGRFPNILPDMVSAHPIPLGGDRFLMNGRVVVVDLELAAAAFRDGISIFPVMVDEATYELTPTLTARAAQTATPTATPVAQTLFEPPPVEMLESVCGGFDDSQDVEMYDGAIPGVPSDFVKQRQPMVGVLRWKGDLKYRYMNPGNVSGKRVCSGTLIDHDLFLTAGHCITPPPELGHKVPRINGTSTPISKEECATNMRVQFDFQLDPNGNDRPPREFFVVRLEEHVYDHSVGQDYAIVRLEGSPGQDYGVTPLAVVDPPPGSPVCIIGHPQGHPKRIAAGTAVGSVQNWMRYRDLDTNGGSSGSGVLDSPEGPLVGVHISGGCGVENVNYGLRLEALVQVSNILQGLVRC